MCGKQIERVWDILTIHIHVYFLFSRSVTKRRQTMRYIVNSLCEYVEVLSKIHQHIVVHFCYRESFSGVWTVNVCIYILT